MKSSRRKPTQTQRVIQGDLNDQQNTDSDNADVRNDGNIYEQTYVESSPNFDLVEYDHAGNPIISKDIVIVKPAPVVDDISINWTPEFGESSKLSGIDDISIATVTCTSCVQQINHLKKGSAKRHPHLNVIICKKCFSYYGEGKFSTDENGLDEYCRWCAEGGKLICCDFCNNAFCKECIRRNFGRKELSDIDKAVKWRCYVCESQKLFKLVTFCNSVLDYADSKKKHEKNGHGSKVLQTPTQGVTEKAKELFPVVSQCVNTVTDAADMFQKGIKMIQRRYKKDCSSARKAWYSLKKVNNLLKIQAENIKSLQEMLNSVDYNEVKERMESEACQNVVDEKKIIGNLKESEESENLNKDTASAETNQDGCLSNHIEENRDVIPEEESNGKSTEDQNLNSPSLIIAAESSEVVTVANKENGVGSSNKVGGDEISENSDCSQSLLEQTKACESITADKDETDVSLNCNNETNDPEDKCDSVAPKNSDDISERDHSSNENADDVSKQVGKNKGDSASGRSGVDRLPVNRKKERSSTRISARLNKSANPSPRKKIKKNIESSPKEQNDSEHVSKSSSSNVDNSEKRDSNIVEGNPQNSRKNGKELHTRASDEDKPKDDKSSELENLLTTINKFIVCSADGDVEEENGKSNAETNSESPSSTKDNLKSLELTDSDATLELNEGTEQKNPASGDKKKEIQTDSSHGETEKELEENDNHSQEMEIIENDRVADDFSDNSKRKNLSSAEDILSEDEEDNAVQSIKILMEETEKVTKSLMKSKREKKKDATRKQNREGKLSGVVDDLKSKKSSEVNLAAKKSLLQDTDSDDDVINSKGSDSVSASFSDDSSDNVKKEDHGSIVDRFYTSCTDDKLRQRPLVKIKKCCEILSPEKLCTEKAMSPEKNASDDPDQIDREIANLTNLKSLKKKKKKKSVDVGDPRSENKKKSQSSTKKKKVGSSSEENNDSSDADKDEILKKEPEKSNEDCVEVKSKNELAKALLENDDDSMSSENEQIEVIDKKLVKETKKEGTKTDNSADGTKVKKSNFKQCKLLKMNFDLSDDSSNDVTGNKTKKENEISKKNRSEGSSSDDSDNSSTFNLLKKRKRKSRKVSSGKSDVSSDSDFVVNRKNKFKRKNSDGSQSPSSDDDNATKDKKKKRKRVKGLTSSNDGSNDDQKKKRRRIKNVSDSDKETVEDGNEDSPSKGRRNIRKLFGKDKLKDETKEAAKAERERRKRVDTRQQLYNEVVEKVDDVTVITRKLVLEVDPKTKEPLIEVHEDLIQELKSHQVDAVKFLWECTMESIELGRTTPGSGCILAHCMGLGKTLSVITFLHTIMNCKQLNFKTVLVVCPFNTVLNWRNEFLTWLKTDELSLTLFELSSERRNRFRASMLDEWIAEGGVTIIGYEMYRNLLQNKKCFSKRQKEIFKKSLLDPGPDIVVCDEGHVLRNSSTGISKTISEIKTLRRIVMTGTPLQNNLKEYHCMVSFVKPKLLGTFKEFSNRFMNPITNGLCSDSTPRDVKLMKKRAHILFNLLNGCVQSRDYSHLRKLLTPKSEYVISIRLTDLQQEMYKYYLENRQSIVKGCANVGATLFRDYHVFQMISNHPWLLHLKHNRRKHEYSSESDGSFIDNETTSSSSSSDSDSSADNATKNNGHPKVSSRRNTRSNAQDNDADEPQEELNVVEENWWDKFFKNFEDGPEIQSSGKISLLFEILSDCETIGDKVLLFSQSLDTLDLIESCLEVVHNQNQDTHSSVGGFEYKDWLRGLDYFRMDGSTSAENRSRYTNSFNDPENSRARLFLISTKAGSLGINLVAANRVIIFDASWNPSHDLQAIFRAYRFKQIKPVYVYRFLAQGTMEEKIYDRQIMKQSLSFCVIEEKQTERHFTMADLNDLYSFNQEAKSKHATPMVPKDLLLAELLIKLKDTIVSYHEHDSLLQKEIEEELTEEERRAAWAEYEAEKKGLWDAVTGTLGPGYGACDIGAIIAAILKKKPDLNQEALNEDVERIIEIVRQKQVDAIRERQRQQQAQMVQQNMASQRSILQRQLTADPNLRPHLVTTSDNVQRLMFLNRQHLLNVPRYGQLPFARQSFSANVGRFPYAQMSAGPPTRHFQSITQTSASSSAVTPQLQSITIPTPASSKPSASKSSTSTKE